MVINNCPQVCVFAGKLLYANLHSFGMCYGMWNVHVFVDLWKCDGGL